VAPWLWPVSDLVELTTGNLLSPKAARMASSSVRSPTGVEVPWLLM
jgi:hypothetical protein